MELHPDFWTNGHSKKDTAREENGSSLRGLLCAGLAAGAIGLIAAASAQAAPRSCSNNTLSGAYGAQLKGSAAGLPFAGLDDITADGNGNFSGSGTIAYNGAISQNVPISATYSINSDCSGAVTFSNGATQSLLVTSDGAEVQFIRTDNADDQITGDAASTAVKSCSNSSLKGNYGATLGGEAAGLPFAALDNVVADGNGNFSGAGTLSYNGAIVNNSFSATYTINPDCSGSISFDNGVTQNLVVVNKGAEVRFIRTDNADAVIYGDAKLLRK